MAKSYLNRPDVPRGIANNNPGNIRMGPSDWKGQIPHINNLDGEFEQFRNILYGLRAMMVLIRNYIKQGNNTIRDIIRKYAPDHENPTGQYVQFVANKTGYSPSQTLAPTKPVVTRLAWAMLLFENGSEASQYVSKNDVSKAYSMIGNANANGNGKLAAAGLGVGLLIAGTYAAK